MSTEVQSEAQPDAPGGPTASVGVSTPRPAIEGPVRSVGWGAFLLLVAGLALALDVGVWILGGGQGWPQSPLLLVPWLAYLGQRLRARPALQAVLEDPRPPVIYFRSFSVERAEARIHSTGRIGDLPAETRLLPSLERIGPVLAIGRPGERLALIGAARLYVVDDDWKEVAQTLLHNAGVVVVRADPARFGQGLAWEIAAARRILTPDKLVVWLPSGLSARQLESLHTLIGATPGSELPPAPAKGGFLRFGSGWQARWTESLDDVPSVPRQPSGAQSPTSPSPLRGMLTELRAQEVAPPRFRLHLLAWLLGVLWLALLVGGGTLYMIQTDRGGPLAAALFEAAFVGFAALVLAFSTYLKWPHQRLGSSLVFAAMLLADASWYITRHLPSAAEVEQGMTELESRICRKAFACTPIASRDAEIDRCLRQQKDEAARVGPALYYVHQTALTKCEVLECEAFAECLDREAGMIGLPTPEKQRLRELICRALQDRSVPDPASASWTAVERALEALNNPALAAALAEEGRRTCPVGNR